MDGAVGNDAGSAKAKCLVSACLVGFCTRYDGQCKPLTNCFTLLRRFNWVPICPEQLGGLATPRMPAELVGGDGRDVLRGEAYVITRDGCDVTSNFVKGAYQCLQMAQMLGANQAFLRAKSPSCGVNPMFGVTAALLQQHGVMVTEF